MTGMNARGRKLTDEEKEKRQQNAQKNTQERERNRQAYAETQREAQEEAETIPNLESAIKEVNKEIAFVVGNAMHDEAELEALQAKAQALQTKLDEKRKQGAAPTGTSTEERLRRADALFAQLGGEEVAQPVQQLRALQARFASRIAELQELKKRRELTDDETKELTELRQTNHRIRKETETAPEAAQARKRKREAKERQQKALDEPSDRPKQHLTPADESWWDKTGKRQWKARREQEAREEALRDADLPLPSARPPVPEDSIDLSDNPDNLSSAQRAARLTDQLQELGRAAIEQLVADEAEVQAALARAKEVKERGDPRPKGKRPKKK